MCSATLANDDPEGMRSFWGAFGWGPKVCVVISESKVEMEEEGTLVRKTQAKI